MGGAEQPRSRLSGILGLVLRREAEVAASLEQMMLSESGGEARSLCHITYRDRQGGEPEKPTVGEMGQVGSQKPGETKCQENDQE